MTTADSETSPRLPPEGLLAGFAVGIAFALGVVFPERLG
jgi:hypothetical protein